MMTLKEVSLGLHSLSIFRDLLHDEVIKELMAYLDLSDEADDIVKADLFCRFVSSLYCHGMGNLSRYVNRIVNESENVYVKAVGEKKDIPDVLKKSLDRDLKILNAAAHLTSGDLYKGSDIPEWITENCDIMQDYHERINNIAKYGYGIYAKYHMFYISEQGSIMPVTNPDITQLSELIDYKREQKIIIDNTKALIAGKPAANILLTGDAGTGKSSTIKAVINELYSEGLRVIEVRKEHLHYIPKLLDELNSNPLKFIIFIDDLSFTKDDDNFSSLKAILEGSVSAKANNIAIYATSNRRHLVKESFSDRNGDDVHFNDTMQELLSLSERFGIQLTFNRPDKSTYLDIVHNLADKQNLKYNTEKLDLEAEKFVLKRGNRSARAAKQFVDGIIAGNITNII